MRRRGAKLILGLLILVLISGVFNQSKASGEKRVLILDLPRFDLAEITPEYPHLSRLVAGSATGLVAIPTIHYPLKPAQIYLYFNSGARLRLPAADYRIYNAQELVGKISAGELYASYTGINIAPENAVNLDLDQLVKLNSGPPADRLGYFGQLLHGKGLKTAAIGNADTDQPWRFGAALLMDQAGVIDFGAIGDETLRRDRLFLSGMRTDPERILKYYRQFRRQAAVVVITLGDLERIEYYKEHLTPVRKEFYRKTALRRYDRLVGRLVAETNFNDTLMLVFTCLPPAKPHVPDNGLTPVLIKGAGFKGGLLYSGNTRKTGHVTYADLRHTMLLHLQPDPAAAESGPLQSKVGDWQVLVMEQVGQVSNYSLRLPLLTGYAALLIGLTGLLIIGLRGHFRPRSLKILAWSYLLLLAVPVIFLLEAIINPTHWAVVLLITLGGAGLILGGTWLAGVRRIRPVLIGIALFSTAVILGDGLFNGFCEFRSFLGYSAVSGKRYYGIGNEYMGVLLGAYIVGITLLIKRWGAWRKPLLWTAWAVISLIFFHPNWGADVGGGITALVGLGICNHLWLRQPIRLKSILLLALALALTLGGIGIWDGLVNRNNISHLGLLVRAIEENGFGSFSTMVLRKLEMSWWVMGYTPLSLVLLGLLVAVPWCYRCPPPTVKAYLDQNPDISRGFLGLCLTALVGFLVNDSGIVSAVLMVAFGLFMLLLPLLEERIG